MITELDHFLKSYTLIEKEQKNNKAFISDIPPSSLNHDHSGMKILNNYFFQNKEVYINKHNRFAPYPAHSHQFLELNYIYSGTCEQIINGEKKILYQGDILLMDTGSQHSILPLDEHDILINLLFRNENIDLNWLNKMKQSQSLMFDFLLNSADGQKHSDYAYFKSNPHSKISAILDQILDEYFFPKDFSNEVISDYLPILFTELVRNYRLSASRHFSDEFIHSPIVAVFKEIETHYQTSTLSSVAEQLNYNKNYLSNLIKNKTGQTFTQLLNKQRLLKARLLIESTRLSVSDIIQKVGFSNRNYFYKAYKEAYHELPIESRNKKAD